MIDPRANLLIYPPLIVFWVSKVSNIYKNKITINLENKERVNSYRRQYERSARANGPRDTLVGAPS